MFDRLARLVDRQLPHALIKSPNPLFEYETRGIEDHVLRQRLKRYRIPVIVSFLVLASASYFLSIKGGIPGILFVLSSVVVALVADLHFLSVANNAIGRPIESGQWDMLRMTGLRRRDILAAKYAVTQIRVWEVMSLDVALRLVGVALASGTILGQLFPPGLFKYYRLTSSTVFVPVFFAFFAIVYILEPLWRMRAVVALGLAISAQVHGTTSALLVGLGSLLGMRLLQAAILTIMGGIAFPVLEFLSGWNMLPPSPDLSSLIVYTLVCLFAAGMVYAFYKVLEINAMRRALVYAFQSQ